MQISLLTSSRADYGIYRPLLKRLAADPFFELDLIAFGTHLSRFHGYTVDQIRSDGFKVNETVETILTGDSEEAISTAMALTGLKFAGIWTKRKTQTGLIICLGDRYEMFAAVAASVPFNIPVAHIHGGETTLGAIDDKFRHALTILSDYHFTSAEVYAQRVAELKGKKDNIFNVGALSLDNLNEIPLLSREAFFEKYHIDLSLPTILCTFHPETVSVQKNGEYADILVDTFRTLSNYQVVITMPNADTEGNLIREKFGALSREAPHVVIVENFGTQGYFSCMQHCAFLLGNTSSGIVEAPSFGKYVINIGDRQKGRARNANVIDIPVYKEEILKAVNKVSASGNWKGENIYGRQNTAHRILEALRSVSSQKNC